MKGTWYDADITNDMPDKTLHGFDLFSSYNSEDEKIVIIWNILTKNSLPTIQQRVLVFILFAVF